MHPRLYPGAGAGSRLEDRLLSEHRFWRIFRILFILLRSADRHFPELLSSFYRTYGRLPSQQRAAGYDAGAQRKWFSTLLAVLAPPLPRPLPRASVPLAIATSVLSFRLISCPLCSFDDALDISTSIQPVGNEKESPLDRHCRPHSQKVHGY